VIFAVGAFFVILALVLGVYWAFIIRPESRSRDALNRRLKSRTGMAAVRAGLLKRTKDLSTVPAIDALLRGHQSIRPIELLIEQSGARITVSVFLFASAACGGVVLLALLQLVGMLLIAVPAAAFATLVPTFFLRFKRTRRLLKFEEQFPEALDLMARALRAGHAFTTGLAMVAEEMPDPIGPEFRLLHEQQNFGMPLPDALKSFARRIPLLDGRFFATAVLIQRESGGNLSEVLDNLASVIRDRFRVKRQIRVISAHGRISGWVLVAVPPSLAFVLFLINPDHLRTLTTDPLGTQIIMAGLCLQVVGTLIIRKLIQIEY
jgi:tight adherence protein B